MCNILHKFKNERGRKMNKGIERSAEVMPRLLGAKELQAYTGLGANKSAELGKNAGAVRRYGKRVLYDRLKVDAYIENEMQEA